MIIERDVPIPCDDGLLLRADVFRPDQVERAPVIMTLGPYGKGVEYKEGYAHQWEWLTGAYPDLLPGSTRSFMTWETVDPETWVPQGYAVIRVDSRGAGRSPGFLDILSPREVRDYHDAIEWAGTQPWSSGKVGLLGISYYAINQWRVASLQPPHLAAMIPWEGAADFYRDFARHGGIASNAFFESWYPKQVLSVQHGNPAAPHDRWRGESATGPERFSADELAARRADPLASILAHPLDDAFYRERSPDWSKVTVPFLSAASWAGFGLHPRGNFEAFTRAASKEKWLEAHPGRHEEWFYLARGMDLQRRFFDHFLKGEKNGWSREPRVQLNIRRPFRTEVEPRAEASWPLARTVWTPLYLSTAQRALTGAPAPDARQVTFDAMGEPVTFLTTPLEIETEITGPLAATLYVSSSTGDADLFLTLQAFDPSGREVEFQGTVDPHTPLAQGWLRASHRKLDRELSTPYRPYHTHDQEQPLVPGQVYELEVEIWPTCIVLPAGFRLALQVSGHDFERAPSDNMYGAWVMRGSGPWLHTHPEDRPAAVYGGQTTIHSGPDHPSRLLVPLIPKEQDADP